MIDNKINGRMPEEIKKGLECCGMAWKPVDCEGCPYTGSIGCGNEMHDDALAYIQQLEEDRKERDIIADAYQELEAAQPKWISVDDELPEGKCVAVNGLGFMLIGYVRKRTNGKGYRCDDENDVFGMMGVTHWMSLPTPPEERTQ